MGMGWGKVQGGPCPSCVDEAMCLFRGRIRFHVYNTKQASKMGSEAVRGLWIRFSISVGLRRMPQSSPEKVEVSAWKEWLPMPDPVMNLGQNFDILLADVAVRGWATLHAWEEMKGNIRLIREITVVERRDVHEPIQTAPYMPYNQNQFSTSYQGNNCNLTDPTNPTWALIAQSQRPEKNTHLCMGPCQGVIHLARIEGKERFR